MSRTPMNAT
jgi:hypothetical protein